MVTAERSHALLPASWRPRGAGDVTQSKCKGLRIGEQCANPRRPSLWPPLDTDVYSSVTHDGNQYTMLFMSSSARSKTIAAESRSILELGGESHGTEGTFCRVCTVTEVAGRSCQNSLNCTRTNGDFYCLSYTSVKLT